MPKSRLTTIINDCADIGGIFSMSYSKATVVTSDSKKAAHGGIPQSGFLLAAAVEYDAQGNFALLDEEVVLLRVADITPLPNERELTTLRTSTIIDAHETNQDYRSITDNATLVEQQRSGFLCDVIGVYYTGVDGRTVEFGADLDNVWSAAHYKVFMPSAKALSWIGSYPMTPTTPALRVGRVRFSATQRDARRHGLDGAEVKINVDDLVARKTSVFGMTRVGKSNTIKTIVTAVAQNAAETGQKCGQILFDPQGEYANINEQDGTGLRLLGDDDQVRIYTTNPRGGDAKEQPLRLNFYDTSLFDVIWGLITEALSIEAAHANYIKGFIAADMDCPDPNDHSAVTHWSRGHMAFYGLLSKAGYKGTFPSGVTLPFSMKDTCAKEFKAANPGSTLSGGSGNYSVAHPTDAAKVVDFIQMKLANADKLAKSNKEEEQDEARGIEELYGKWRESDQFCAVAEMFKWTRGRGLNGLRAMRDFHDPAGTGDVAEMVWDDMLEGRLAIIDLSIGSEIVTKVMSERLVTALITKASTRFRNGQKAVPFQVVVEEAHNLFERGRSSNDDPWVRMSKEAAKYKIGLVYATQEVTSVDQRILSNTANWFIGHLNSDIELRELAKYYDFGSYGDSLKRAEDRGFFRIKTFSSPYIVPVQIDKFDHDMINAARKAAGLEPVHGLTTPHAPAPQVENPETAGF